MSTLPSDPPHPACFDTQADFNEWCKYANRVKEFSSPCDDCTEEYKDRMGPTRCHEATVREVFVLSSKAPRKY